MNRQDRPLVEMDATDVRRAYRRWAPVYDLVFGKVFDEGRKSTIAEADKIGGRVLDVGVGTGLSLSEYSRNTKLCGVDISEPMLRRARKRVREFGLSNDGVGYALDKYNQALIPQAVAIKLEVLKKQIIAGQIKVPSSR